MLFVLKRKKPISMLEFSQINNKGQQTMTRNTLEDGFLLHIISGDSFLPIYLFLLSSKKKKIHFFLCFWIFQDELHLPVYKPKLENNFYMAMTKDTSHEPGNLAFYGFFCSVQSNGDETNRKSNNIQNDTDGQQITKTHGILSWYSFQKTSP